MKIYDNVTIEFSLGVQVSINNVSQLPIFLDELDIYPVSPFQKQ